MTELCGTYRTAFREPFIHGDPLPVGTVAKNDTRRAPDYLSLTLWQSWSCGACLCRIKKVHCLNLLGQ